jgi:hypothetical protein
LIPETVNELLEVLIESLGKPISRVGREGHVVERPYDYEQRAATLAQVGSAPDIGDVISKRIGGGA